jgi:hypothetical protein
MCNAGNAYFYTVKDIVVFVENMDEALAVYRKKAVEARVTAVVELDKSALRGFLTGLTATAPQIDQQAAVSFVAPAAPRPVAPSAPSGTEKTQEQRDKLAARAERKSKDAGDSAHSMKRKIAAAFGADEGVDADILEADRQRLKELRSDEIPAHTRSTVLNNSGMVSTGPCLLPAACCFCLLFCCLLSAVSCLSHSTPRRPPFSKVLPPPSQPRHTPRRTSPSSCGFSTSAC